MLLSHRTHTSLPTVTGTFEPTSFETLNASMLLLYPSVCFSLSPCFIYFSFTVDHLAFLLPEGAIGCCRGRDSSDLMQCWSLHAAIPTCWVISPAPKLHLGSSAHFSVWGTGQFIESCHGALLVGCPPALSNLTVCCLYNVVDGSCGSCIIVYSHC